MGKLSSIDPTLVRVDANFFFDHPSDELGTIGVVTEIEPREDELRVKMGLGDCGLHGTLLYKMGRRAGKTPLSEEMVYSQAIIRGSFERCPRISNEKILTVVCTLFGMRDESNLSPQQTADYAYIASLTLGGLLSMPRERRDRLNNPNELVFGAALVKRLDKRIGQKIITDRQ